VLDSALKTVVSALMLFRREFMDASRAIRSAMAIMAEAVPFFRNSILKVKDCTPISPP
jgi:hypothetical protein